MSFERLRSTVFMRFGQNPVLHAALLGAFAFISAVLLGTGNISTRDAIRERAAEDLRESLTQVIPAGLHDNLLDQDTAAVTDLDGRQRTVYRARRGGEVVAVAFEWDTPGYSGTIRLLLGVRRDGTILGVRVLSHSETPGLGDKIDVRKHPWIHSFDDRSLGNPAETGWRVKQDGGQFDQFAGATITPRAVVSAVHEGLRFFAARRALLLVEGPGGR